MPKGDCFIAALHVAETLAGAGHDRVLICHGRPIGRGTCNFGKRYWHAWVEVKVDGEWYVFDHSNDFRVQTRRALYYKLGLIAQDGETVLRINLREARRLMLEHDHYGPWVPGAQFDGTPGEWGSKV